MFARPVLPRRWPPGWNRPPLGFILGLTPPTRSRTTHAEVGTGHQARTWNYPLHITPVDPPIGSSLIACDLASHRPNREEIRALELAAGRLRERRRRALAGRHESGDRQAPSRLRLRRRRRRRTPVHAKAELRTRSAMTVGPATTRRVSRLASEALAASIPDLRCVGSSQNLHPLSEGVSRQPMLGGGCATLVASVSEGNLRARPSSERPLPAEAA